jgi:lipopolysaccharide transport system permease protein
MATMLAPFRALITHRQAIQIFVNRDIRGRYINSALGLWWAVIQPLALLALYTFVFSSVMSVRLSDSAGTGEFALYAFCGLLPWLAVADALTRSSSILLDQTPLIKKVVFPTEILPVHLVLSALLVEIVGLAVFLAVVIVGGRLPGWSVLILPLVMVLQFFFMTGIAWLLSTLALYLRDVRQVVGLLLTLWMFLTPIVYPASLVPVRFRWVLDINPMTAIVDAYRAALLDNRMPAPASFVLFAAVAFAVFVSGHWVFMRSKPTFADLL